MHFNGYYINLLENTDRDARMQQQLSMLQIAENYRRFDAIRGAVAPQRSETTLPDGHLGCWLSHQAVWREGQKTGQHLHVLEDDAVIGPSLMPMLKELDLDEHGWDLLFTDVYFHPPPTPEQFASLMRWMQTFSEKKQITLVDLRELPFTGTTSYLVNRASIKKLLDLTDGQWKLNRTFDVMLQILVREGRILARTTIPFLTTIGPENIASTTGAQGPALAALNAFREALYYRSNPKAIYEKMMPCACENGTEPTLGIYLELLRHVLGTMKIIV